ncbi:hypothetical protein BESB_051720 [Besnoitia besnoiti]|uniref:Uncharacterized protein n=1 Tax=Besnoitia besnoiti TaxID=94643 RepID=A0A2A9MGX6_BESBE|nr:hypothetical protein BESB_051720 [Besnoitia besnoiti]PFH35521.1 hypothetical protein BESB_051720 [Besnoitia besnoiti]
MSACSSQLSDELLEAEVLYRTRFTRHGCGARGAVSLLHSKKQTNMKDMSRVCGWGAAALALVAVATASSGDHRAGSPLTPLGGLLPPDESALDAMVPEQLRLLDLILEREDLETDANASFATTAQAAKEFPSFLEKVQKSQHAQFISLTRLMPEVMRFMFRNSLPNAPRADAADSIRDGLENVKKTASAVQGVMNGSVGMVPCWRVDLLSLETARSSYDLRVDANPAQSPSLEQLQEATKTLTQSIYKYLDLLIEACRVMTYHMRQGEVEGLNKVGTSLIPLLKDAYASIVAAASADGFTACQVTSDMIEGQAVKAQYLRRIEVLIVEQQEIVSALKHVGDAVETLGSFGKALLDALRSLNRLRQVPHPVMNLSKTKVRGRRAKRLAAMSAE